MTRRARASRRRANRADVGASWISYSDMMAALLLVFILILCYSMYQYFVALESKSMELEDQQIALSAKQSELAGALGTIDEKQGLLDLQSMTLEELEKTIFEAQVALQEQEEALAFAEQRLSDKEALLDESASQLAEQQRVLDAQQEKLDDLAGVKTEIIQELSKSLAAANLKPSVDTNTGDIMLESAIFFDLGRNTIKDSGRKLLDEFITVYLSVLLRPEYTDSLSEIIIEGHTDTVGPYLRNLELSQERALSVVAYCLEMRTLTEEQRVQLRQILTAKGRSFSNPVYAEDGSVDMAASRRVEFKFRLKDAEMIDEIRTILAQ